VDPHVCGDPTFVSDCDDTRVTPATPDRRSRNDGPGGPGRFALTCRRSERFAAHWR